VKVIDGMAPHDDSLDLLHAYRYCPRCASPMEPRRQAPGEPEFPTCTRCGFILFLNPDLSVGAIVPLEGGIVLLRRAIQPCLGLWTFPMGYANRGERTERAAERETFEEVGLETRVRELIGVYSYEGRPVAVVVYEAEAIGGTLAPGAEAIEVRSVRPESIPWEELAFPSARDALRDYLRRRGWVPPD